MGRSYLGCRENILTAQIMLFCSYGEIFSRLPGKVSCFDVDFVKCKQKVFPLSGKVVFIYGIKIISDTEISLVSKRDLGTRENFSSHMSAMQLSLSKCFLGNRDNFCPYQQLLYSLVVAIFEGFTRFRNQHCFTPLRRLIDHLQYIQC